MSDVLGLLIKAMQKNYHSICEDKGITAQAVWGRKPQSRTLSSMKRYDWGDFANYMADLTSHLRQHQVEPYEFQKKLIPVMFTRIMAGRLSRMVFTPTSVLKAIDVWAGPFMFRAALATTYEADGSTIMEINLKDGCPPSYAFFEHTVAGVQATLSTLAFDSSKVRAVLISGRKSIIEVRTTTDDQPIAFTHSQAQVRKNMESLLEDLRLELNNPDFPDSLNMHHWLESMDHFSKVVRNLDTSSDKLIDCLTRLSSRVQLAANADLDSDTRAIQLSECRDALKTLELLAGL